MQQAVGYRIDVWDGPNGEWRSMVNGIGSLTNAISTAKIQPAEISRVININGKIVWQSDKDDE